MMIGSLPPPSSRAGGRAGMEGKDLGAIETLSREISCLRHTMGEWDFSTVSFGHEKRSSEEMRNPSPLPL